MARIMNAITISMWRRPGYSRQTIEALSRCLGFENWKVFVGINPYEDLAITDELEALATHLLPGGVITRRPEDVGCNLNVKMLHDKALEDSDFVLHLDDDVILARDALRLCEWVIPFGQDLENQTMSCWKVHPGWMPGHLDKPPGEDSNVSRQKAFMVYAWGTWRDRWSEMRQKWPSAYFPEGPDSYDWVVDQGELSGKSQIVPNVSRAISIGAKDGLHKDTDIILPYWAGMDGFKPVETFTKTW